jgi:pimeloyl-ACP methyl ester carboxylesterase
MKVRMPDFTMAYEDLGSGRPVLFIHGYPLNRRMWGPQVSRLSSGARVLAPDLRGHGESEPAPGPYPMETLANDCYQLLEAVGERQPAVICGLSMGGYVTLAFYRLYPERVAGLILAATRAGADSAEGKANREKAAAQAQEHGVQAIVEAMLPKMLAPKTYETNPELVARVRGIMEMTSVEGVVGALLGMRDRPDSTPSLAGITVPTLILHGSDDQIIPFKEAEAMQAAIPNAKLRLLPDAGHLLNLEQPERFNQAVENYLASLE